MGTIIVRRGDLEIEVKEKTDLRSVLDALGDRQLQMPLGQEPQPEQMHQPEPADSVPTEEAFKVFYGYTHGKAVRSLIDALYSSAKGLSDSQVRKILGLKANSELAGIVSGVVKNERKAGLPDHSAVGRERKGTAGDYSYKYWLTDACRLAIASLVDLSGNGSSHIQNGEAT